MVREAIERLNAPAWNGQAPFIEDWFVQARVPDEATSLWVRYTLDASVDDAAARVWAILERGGETTARRASVHATELELSGEPFGFRTPHGELTSEAASGDLDGVRWELTWEPSPYSLWPLPSWAYDLPDAVGKVVDPNPSVRIQGQLRIEGDELDLEAVPGQQGHAWGRSHAPRWAWAHAEPADGIVWEALAARARVLGKPTPTVALAVLRVGERTLGFRNLLVNRAEHDADGFTLEARTLRHRLRLTAEPGPGELRGVRYPDPLHGAVHCHNTKRGTSELVLEERGLTGWREVERFREEGATAFEVGRTQPIDGVPQVLP